MRDNVPLSYLSRLTNIARKNIGEGAEGLGYSPPKNSPRSIFRNTQRGWRQLFIA